jgi:hypothetical protein
MPFLPRPAPRLAPLFLFLIFLGSVSGLRAAGPSSSSPEEPSATAQGSTRLTLDSYAAMKKEAEETVEGTEGPERIARCEAFLKAHPDYPNRGRVLLVLVQDSLQTGSFDPAAMAARLEQVASLSERSGLALEEPDSYAWEPVWLVADNYFRYGLPLDSAQRLIDLGWKRLAQVRRMQRRGGKARGTLWRSEEENYDDVESSLRLDEARLKLARGDAAGALQSLRAGGAEKKEDEPALLLRNRADGATRRISLPGDDWREVTLAGATAALGKREQAREHLDRAMTFGEITPDLKDALEHLRRQLDRPAPEALEIRGEPVEAAELTMKDLEGKTSHLADFRGRVVLLLFWTTW